MDCKIQIRQDTGKIGPNVLTIYLYAAEITLHAKLAGLGTTLLFANTNFIFICAF